MGREVRRVPRHWQHPVDDRGKCIPLHATKWDDCCEHMPQWSDEQKTHYQMYENTSEGTPIGPVFETPEKLARWLADNNASSFGTMRASYEQWLAVCLEGSAPSMVLDGMGLRSGVEAMGDYEKEGGK